MTTQAYTVVLVLPAHIPARHGRSAVERVYVDTVTSNDWANTHTPVRAAEVMRAVKAARTAVGKRLKVHPGVEKMTDETLEHLPPFQEAIKEFHVAAVFRGRMEDEKDLELTFIACAKIASLAEVRINPHGGGQAEKAWVDTDGGSVVFTTESGRVIKVKSEYCTHARFSCMMWETEVEYEEGPAKHFVTASVDFLLTEPIFMRPSRK